MIQKIIYFWFANYSGHRQMPALTNVVSLRDRGYDFGKALNSGSHLTALRRTKIGDYDVKNAIDITLFEESLNFNS